MWGEFLAFGVVSGNFTFTFTFTSARNPGTLERSGETALKF
jgi:hypothetical protein